MNNTTTTTAGTAQAILDFASFDYEILESLNATDLFREFHKEATDISKDMSEQGYDWAFFSNNNIAQKELNNTLKYILFNSGCTIQIQQNSINPYTFKFYTSPNNRIGIFPLLIARKLIYFIKSLGYKITVDKQDKSLVSERTALFRDLCFRGKSDISIPVYIPVANIAKKVRNVIPCWSTPVIVEEEKKEDNISQASMRFRGAEWFNATQQDVTLIGAGGLGSNIAVSLCRLLGNKKLVIYDPDVIEYKNLAGQNFGISNLGEDKAMTVKEQCLNFNPSLHCIGNNQSFEEFRSLPFATVTGLDNMATRSLVYYKWIQKIEERRGMEVPPDDITTRILIDARLSAETWQVFCITSDNKKAQEEYESKWLFSDEEADEGVCSYKQTAFAAQMCASFVTNLYVNFCTNSIKGKDDPTRRFLPFMTEYDASQMILRFQDI